MSNKNTRADKLPAAQVNVNLIEQYVKGMTLNTIYSKYALSKLKGKLSTDFVVAPVMKKLDEEDDVYEVILNINGVAKLDGMVNEPSANSNEVYKVRLEYADPINFQQIFLQHKERQPQHLGEAVH